MNHSIEHHFPNLRPGEYEVTSPASDQYNCVAWAAGQSETWWEPDAADLYFWPPGLPRLLELDAYVRAFATLGYVYCHTGDLEPGVEKVALYADPKGTPTHAARQLPNGRWTSKLGQLEDIEHETLDCLSGAAYGTVTILLRRAIQNQPG
ncbi:MAG: DUF7689 domain-containing protein [Candidatus Binatia bacterium]